MNNELKELKNSTLLQELVRRIKLKQIRFNYDGIYKSSRISGLISWDALDEYSVDFNDLEKHLEKDGNLLTDGEIANLIRIITKEVNHE